MATIAPPLPKKKPEPPEEKGGKGGGFDQGFDGSGGNGSESGASLPDRRYYTGMFMGLAAILMLFAAFTSALVVRKGLSDDWQATALPGILWPNTVLLLASSFTLEKARRCYEIQARFQRWWWVTTALGVTFLAGQLLAWQQLVAGGVYVNTNPSSSFFYLLTGTHGVHLLGGVIALLYLAWKVRRRNLNTPGATIVGVTALYWHFMDGLWLYLFVLLLLWR
ncbi:heme-copper oxidase subunit III [Acidobacteria bacterium AH-259-D05]|nr:heme-copper oxidase subunit III [Acidobacteria bacterium AH-259-D05]